MSNKKKEPKIIVIVGPTASGKSALAVALARKFNGEIISADSRQVYKGFNLGAGKITKKERRGIRHYLLDVVSPKRTFTAAQYQKLARQVLNNILSRGKLPIICGGTGFYIQALIDGLVLPAVKPNQRLRKELSKKTTAELFKKLKKLDPRRAQNIDSKNQVRLIRALEIVESLGKVPQQKTNPLPEKILMLGIKKNVDALKRSIERRLIKRMHLGMIKEIKNLHARGLSWRRLQTFGLEYRYGALLLKKKISREKFRKDLVQATLKYAKRQMTWFKRDKRIHWIRNKNQAFPQVVRFLA